MLLAIEMPHIPTAWAAQMIIATASFPLVRYTEGEKKEKKGKKNLAHCITADHYRPSPWRIITSFFEISDFSDRPIGPSRGSHDAPAREVYFFLRRRLQKSP